MQPRVHHQIETCSLVMLGLYVWDASLRAIQIVILRMMARCEETQTIPLEWRAAPGGPAGSLLAVVG